MAHANTTGSSSESHPEKSAVLEQLQRVLGHRAFKSSKRSRALLSYTVEHQLQGNTAELKERTLGIEVFGRKPDYDTNADPVVRIAVGEVRKRIAEYYYEPGHEDEIRIELPLGSYHPVFHVPSTHGAERAAATEPRAAALPDLAAQGGLPKKRWLPYAVSACFLAALVGTLGWRIRPTPVATTAVSAKLATAGPTTAVDQFWGGVIASPGPINLVLGSTKRPSPAANVQHSFRQFENESFTYFPDMVGWRDLTATSTITGFLRGKRKAYRMEDSRTTTIKTLAQGPAVLIGAFNNPWTIRLTDSLRFHFETTAGTSIADGLIADRENPHQGYPWATGRVSGSFSDYALIARLSNTIAGKPSVIVAGIGAAGTLAASAFLTNAQDVNELVKHLPKDWASRNIEAVISVNDFHGEPGAVHILAVDCW